MWRGYKAKWMAGWATGKCKAKDAYKDAECQNPAAGEAARLHVHPVRASLACCGPDSLSPSHTGCMCGVSQ